MSDRLTELQRWAHRRIQQCRRDEAKFGSSDVGVEAARERMLLQTVLQIAGLPEPEREHLYVTWPPIERPIRIHPVRRRRRRAAPV